MFQKLGAFYRMRKIKNIKRRIYKICINLFIKIIQTKDTEEIINKLERKIGIGINSDISESGERVSIECVKKILSSDYIIFDVGANIGEYTELVTRIFESKKYIVHAFEPSAYTFNLFKNKHGNNKNVVCNNFGLFSETCNSILYTDKKGSGKASLTERRLEHFNIEHGKLKENISLYSLDDYCKKNNIEKIDLLKLDVEGHELDVLNGAENLFKQKRIKIIQFEFGGCNIDTKTYFQDYYYFFDKYGFQIFRIIPGEMLMKIKTYKETYEKFRTTNYLVCDKEIPLETIINSKIIK